jgi:hypothetical protein
MSAWLSDRVPRMSSTFERVTTPLTRMRTGRATRCGHSTEKFSGFRTTSAKEEKPGNAV